MVITCLGVAVIAALVFGPAAGVQAGLEAIFALTTAGFLPDGDAVLPVTLLVSLAVVGGSALSTSGGLKITRVVLLLRRAAGELSLLAHPAAAVYTRFAGRHIRDSALVGVWVFALVFPLSIGAVTFLLGLTGLDFATAWPMASALVANAGPLAGGDYGALSPAGQLVGVLAMIAGRMEILAAAAAVFVILVRE